jgi:WD40 repeat protein
VSLHLTGLNPAQTEGLTKWPMDASRFLNLHWNTIRDNPLRVYHEFAFAPQSSIFHQVYSKMESFPHPVVRFGLDAEWPSGGTVQTYYIWTSCMSRSEDILITGGEREGCAVYSIWDTRSSYGETFVHPCKSDGCRVNHVSIDQREEIVELQTGCRCGTLCRWNMSSDPHCLLEETRSGSLGKHWWWADDGSKVVSRMENGSIQLCILSIPLVHYHLWDEMELSRWQFSPGPGDKVLGCSDRRSDNVLAVWECASGRKLFRKSCPKGMKARFSPDGTTVACAGGGAAELISAEDGTVLRSWDGIERVNSIKFFPKGDKFLIRTEHRVHLFDGDIRPELKMHCHSICISPDGQRVAIIGYDYIDIFNPTLDERLERHKLNSYPSDRTYFSRNHSILLSVKNYSISFHHLSHNAPNPSSTVENLFLSPDSRHLLTFHLDKSIHVWYVKSGRRLHTFDNGLTGSSGTIGVKYALNSSGVLVWDHHRLMVLQFSAGLIKWPFSVPQASSALLAAALFPNSNHLLVIHSDRNVTTVSLNDMSTRVMSPLYSPVQKIRQMVISPTEQFVAICSDVGLVIYGIGQDMYRIPLFSEHVKGAGFSPDGTKLYILEANGRRGMLSRVDARTWTVHRIWAEYVYPHLQSCTETMIGDCFSVLRNSWGEHGMRIDKFIDLSSGKQVIPPSSRVKSWDILYQNEWITELSAAARDELSITQDHLAYIHRGKAFVVDYSPLVKQA